MSVGQLGEFNATEVRAEILVHYVVDCGVIKVSAAVWIGHDVR